MGEVIGLLGGMYKEDEKVLKVRLKHLFVVSILLSDMLVTLCIVCILFMFAVLYVRLFYLWYYNMFFVVYRSVQLNHVTV